MVTTEKIDIEQIMEDIRNEIEYKKENNLYPHGVTQEIKRFKTKNIAHKELSELQTHIRNMAHHSYIYYKPMVASSKFLIGPLLTIVKKIISKLTSWYFQGITEQVNAFNNLTLKAFDYVYKELEVSNNLNAPFWWSNYSEYKEKLPSAKNEPSNNELKIKFFAGKENILDIGCGNGQFLKFLKDNKIGAKGVDINMMVVEDCLNQKLPVVHADALDYISNVPINSLGGIHASKLVEYLSPKYLFELFTVIVNKLQSGSYLVIQTANPLSITSATSSFSRDLTNNKLIHPESMAFLLDLVGLQDIETKFVSPIEGQYQLNKIKASDNNGNAQMLKALNENIDKLNSAIFGFQEYIITAKKQ